MKILSLLLCLSVVILAVKPPSPVCRVSPLPSLIPITVGQELRFDLENVFSGYNLFFDAPKKDHITVAQKYEITQKKFNSSMNFTSAKLKAHNRFLGLIANNNYTGLAIGTNNQSNGVTIDKYIVVEDQPNLHCYDVDEVSGNGKTFAIIDCGVFIQGELLYNRFLYVDLATYVLHDGTSFSDTFVNYHMITRRKIEVIEDPFSRISYMLRFQLRDGVDQGHMNQNYVQIFLMSDPENPQLFDVLDHTFLELDKLSIIDYQVHMNIVYLLVYNKGLYQFRITPDMHIRREGFFQWKLDCTRFHVDQIGFNDDLNVVITNGNTVYQLQWIIPYAPTIQAKYTLMPYSDVIDIFTDFNFVLVQAYSLIDTELIRRTYVFTKRTLTYLNAYNVFHAPVSGPSIIHWDQHGTTLHIFQEYTSLNIKMNLPYMDVKPVNSSMANLTEEYTVTAMSYVDQGNILNCTQKFVFIYLMPGDRRIMKTGFWPSQEVYVDSPDLREIPMQYEFYGPNLTYSAKFESVNSSILPYQYSDKRHKAVLNWPPDIKEEEIVYYEMFSYLNYEELKQPKSVYGFVQVEQKIGNQTIHTTHYVHCEINVLDRDETHNLRCKNLVSTRFSLGRILFTSQMWDPTSRKVAIVFSSLPHTVFIYYFWTTDFSYFGRLDYAGIIDSQITGVVINKNMLFVVLEYRKSVEIFSLDDINDPTPEPRNARPRFVINSRIMSFFGIDYFAPVNIKISRFHGEVIFLKTKSGVMGINVNEMYLPQFLFRIPTTNILYDFQVNHQSLLIITQSQTTIYDLQTPLRRNALPLKRQSIDRQYRIGEYDEVGSDRLFYLVNNNSVIVVNPRLISSSAFYSEVYSPDEILSIDAVNVIDKQILFIRTSKALTAWVFAEDPKLFVQWSDKQQNFTMNLTASNLNATSDPYSLKFNVLRGNQTILVPTEKFNKTEIQKLGRVKAPNENKTFSYSISLNDSDWFYGTVLTYRLNCSECGKTIKLTNHVQETRQLVEAKAIYDIESNFQGVFAQQYSSIFKTFNHNDSVHYIVNIPTEGNYEVCNKISLGEFNNFAISLCELGGEVNVYITSLVASKPFVMGPYRTEAKAVNHAKIVGNILMIVDNDDNPFIRAGGVYLYLLNLDLDDDEVVSLLDYLDYQDLQIQGFTGLAYIGSADLHYPYFTNQKQFRLFMTEGRTGAIFIFSFELSPDLQQIIYLSKKYVSLGNIIPKDIKYPTPIRVTTINIHYYMELQNKNIEYYLFLSVANWHHMEIMMTLDYGDNVRGFKLERLFERFPWQLENYFKYKRGHMYETLFAVPYVDDSNSRQIVAVYQVPYILNSEATTYKDKYSPHQYSTLGADQIPILKMLGSHYVRNNFQVAFTFHTFGNDKLLFTDVDGYNITELTISKNITVAVNNITKAQEIIQIQAFNPFMNYTFSIDLDFYKDKDPDPKPDPDPEPIIEKEKVLWIVIICIGAIMIIGLIIAWAKQSKKSKDEEVRKNTETLLTVEDQFHNNYINRSSADPDSIRGSEDLRKQ